MGYEAASRHSASACPPVLTLNAHGRSRLVLVCEHGTNRIPARYGDLRLAPHQRLMHVAWDIGALAVAVALSDLLEAPLVHPTVSRLIVDCNRAPDAVDLVPLVSERMDIVANVGIPDSERRLRLETYHHPFHAAVEVALERVRAAGLTPILVAVHSFTPTHKDVLRPWPVGIIPGPDERFARALAAELAGDDPDLNVGWNEPYAARREVIYTLHRHGEAGRVPACMLEIRHDEILDPGGVARWAARLARTLERASEGHAPIAAQ